MEYVSIIINNVACQKRASVAEHVHVSGIRYARCVIASDVGAVGDIIRQFGFGFTVEPDCPENLRQAIAKFLARSESERQEMESKAKLGAQSHSWDEVCRRIEAVYHRLLEG